LVRENMTGVLQNVTMNQKAVKKHAVRFLKLVATMAAAVNPKSLARQGAILIIYDKTWQENQPHPRQHPVRVYIYITIYKAT